MAERRMFAKTIIDSDAFLSLSTSAQLLYFHIGMRARNKGILNNIISIAKSIGVCELAIEELVNAGYIIYLDNNLFAYQIVHWYENNGTGETAKKRLTYPYRKWRKTVLERDNFKCQLCGSEEQLEAHHIIPLAQDDLKKLEVNNGITLCHNCHFKMHHKKEHKKE